MEELEHRMIKKNINILTAVLSNLERLRDGGCGVATCSEGREAGEDQGSAEEAQPMSDPLIPPEEAKEFLEKWNTRAALERSAGDERVYEACDCPPVYKSEGAADVLEQILPELETLLGVTPSRKAKAAETLEHYKPYTNPALYGKQNQKGS